MATLRATIKLALRRLGVLGPGMSPDAQQEEDALDAANRTLQGLVGLGTSHPIRTIETNVSITLDRDWPAQRVLCTVGGLLIALPERPVDGARIIITDVNGLAAASPITVDGGAMKIEGVSGDLTLNSANVSRALMFRADLGDWRRVTDLAIGDELPFPDDLQEAWIILLMTACESVFDVEMRPNDARMISVSMKRFRARYVKPPMMRPDGGVTSLGGSHWRAPIANTGEFS